MQYGSGRGRSGDGRRGKAGAARHVTGKPGEKNKVSFSIENTYLPKRVKELNPEIDNAYLLFHKAANFVDGKFEVRAFEDAVHKKNGRLFDEHQVSQWAERHWAALRDAGYWLRAYDVTFAGRLVVGLGGSSVYETGLTLHPVYGLPYLPSSSVKGTLAHYIVDQCFGGDKQAAAQDETYQALFGTIRKRGQVVFFDAFPLKAPTLRMDVMNSHYGPYYMRGEPPVDFHNPVPVFFVTVEQPTFRVAIGVSPEVEEKKAAHLLGEAGALLIEALKLFGIGAKTAVGYGYASLCRPVEEA
ncbi:type III-B CRISPR module RAMP protein Cmr6 [Hydrogenibacillus sp. N12]|uniref:type III-B CRISPR module RAMP protein Cmr6 n=1 Tax=Hydrogenibacillus sp. N12 TaxID=2866627 RepID=UPI001C7DA514|nr:type III-B CRISPR module RAMP protein Cmr6 [Hydrogenibacillus sp. N12]QZA32480.1 type III-B CRISPR module RAMP protein Cmr6 [Hydrogenibacillus sp. N12]